MIEFLKEKQYIIQRVLRDETTGCWNWKQSTSRTSMGYGQAHMWGKTMNCHRLAYILWKGWPKEGNVVRHLCNNPKCCNPAHLEEGTQIDNILDCMMADRHTKGERNGRSKITERQAVEIAFKFYVEDKGMTEIGREYGLTRVAVRYIINGKHWSFATGIIPNENSSN